MERLTNEELRAIRERVEKATEGSWEVSYTGLGVKSNGKHIAVMASGQDFLIEEGKRTDATFIAHAREDIPKLLAEIERLREFEAKIKSPLNIKGIDERGVEIELRNVVFDFGGDSE